MTRDSVTVFSRQRDAACGVYLTKYKRRDATLNIVLYVASDSLCFDTGVYWSVEPDTVLTMTQIPFSAGRSVGYEDVEYLYSEWYKI